MAFNVFDSPDQRAAFLIAIITTPVCILLIILRFTYARRFRKIGLEDWFALLSLFFYLVWVVFAIWAVIQENGRNVLQPGALPPATTLAILKFGYAVNPQYCTQQLFAKLSVLSLYHRVFSIDRVLVIMTYTVGIVQIAWFIAQYFDRWFTCTPVRKVWEPAIEGYCINQSASLAVSETVNSGVDFVMIGMAVYMVRQLNVSFSNKWKLSILFAIGGLSGVIGIIRICEVYGKIAKTGDELPWLLSQMATSVICCCAPLQKSIFPDFGILHALQKNLSSLLGRSRVSKDSPEQSNSFRAAGQKPSNNNLRATDDWLALEEARSTSSIREPSSQARTEDTVVGEPTYSGGPTYPTRTLQAH